MKTTMKRLLSLFVMLAILLGSFGFSASAGSFAMDESQWAAYWSSYVQDGKAVYMAPGSDDTEMRFAWISTTNDAKPFVKISKSADMTGSTDFEGCYVSSKTVKHSAHVTVTGLEKGTTYFYQCCAGGETTTVKSFKTVAEGSSFSAVFVSDIHISGTDYSNEEMISRTRNLNNIFAAALGNDDRISLILSAGDQANAGEFTEYVGLFSSPVLKSVPFALCAGNHDRKTNNLKFVANNPNVFKNTLSPSPVNGDYWFVKGDALFLVMDGFNFSASDHSRFVAQAVAANPNAKWRIAVFHQDLYGGHIPDRESEDKLFRLILTPIFDQYGVDLALMGHSHVYSRSHVIYRDKVNQNLAGLASVSDAKGTIYLVSGSANSPRMEEPAIGGFVAFDNLSDKDINYNILNFSGDELTVKAYILGQDTPFDTFTIEKTGTNGGHPADAEPFWYPVVKGLASVYGFISNLVTSLGYQF